MRDKPEPSHSPTRTISERRPRIRSPWRRSGALDPFDLEASLRRISFLFSGKIVEGASTKVVDPDPDVYRSEVE